jgi:MtfA peptidase
MLTPVSKLRSWRRSRILRRSPIHQALWQQVTAQIDALTGLTEEELGRLHDLTVLFLEGKKFFATYEMQINDFVRVAIAAQACLLILNIDSQLETKVYPGWQSIILYPGAFVARHDYRDEIGVTHKRVMALEGEASNHGPVVLSWEDAQPGRTQGDRNVVLHEFAHKLDFLDGTSNGHPPLHRGMSSKTWSEVLSAAFEDLTNRVEHHLHNPFNPYATTNPAEFFAVMTEVFFQTPHRLRHVYPDVYHQFALYYRQDPAIRRPR